MGSCQNDRDMLFNNFYSNSNFQHFKDSLLDYKGHLLKTVSSKRNFSYLRGRTTDEVRLHDTGFKSSLSSILRELEAKI